MQTRKIIFLLNIVVLSFVLTGCGKKEADKKQEVVSKVESTGETSSCSEETEKIGSLTTSGEVKDQLAPPEKGEEVAVFSIKGYGTIKARLFPEVAPNAVKTFKELARSGKYDGVSFHRVIENFMIQAGQELEGKLDKKIEDKVELNTSVHHFNGALCMARTQDKEKGQSGQFYFVSSNDGKNTNFDEITEKININNKLEGCNIIVGFGDKTRKEYLKEGGTPQLDMSYTVFGQAYEGKDVIEKIAACPKEEKNVQGQQLNQESEQNSVPKEPIIIEKVTLEKA